MIKFTVAGRPVPAVRMTQRSKFVNPQAQRYLAYKELVGLKANQCFAEPLQGDVGIKVDYYLFGGRLIDLDNLIKGTCDSLNKIAWMDDKQVVKINGARFTALTKNNEHVEITIYPVLSGKK
jgi:Holliday junction resolvase RusA-like endonuclease